MPSDMIRLIFTYQSPNDLNSITLTSSILQNNGSDNIKEMIRALWYEHITRAWNFNDTNMIIPSHINICKLYPLARPMLGSYILLSTIEDIDLLHINNDEKDNDKSVTFFGQVGQDNRSVQSSVSLALINAAKSNLCCGFKIFESPIIFILLAIALIFNFLNFKFLNIKFLNIKFLNIKFYIYY